jgi:hypothetical protein
MQEMDMAGQIELGGAIHRQSPPSVTPSLFALRSPEHAQRGPVVGKPGDLRKLLADSNNVHAFFDALTANFGGQIFVKGFGEGQCSNGLQFKKMGDLTLVTDKNRPGYAVGLTEKGAKFFKTEGDSLNVLKSQNARPAIEILKKAAVTSAEDPHGLVNG